MTDPNVTFCPYTAPADGYLSHPGVVHRCIMMIPVGGDHLGEHTCGCGHSFVGVFSPSPPPTHPPGGSDATGAATAGRAHGSGEVVYLMWSQTHQAWWGPDAWGYTQDVDQAGRFTEAEAVAYTVSSAASGIRDQVSFLVAAPDNWAGPLPEPAEGWAEHDQAAVRESQGTVMTWLDEVNAHIGREPFLAFPKPIRGGRRVWAWWVDGDNRNIAIDPHFQGEYRVRVAAGGRHAEIFTTGEPGEADIRSALRFVGLIGGES